MFFLGIETPRPNLELAVDSWEEAGVVSSLLPLVFIDRLSGASPLSVVDPAATVVVAAEVDEAEVDEDDDVLGFPINELTSRASGFPLTV